MTLEEISAWGLLLQGVGTLFGAIAVFSAGLYGANTYKRWRRQKIDERRFEFAERIAVAAYNARRQLSYIRQPFLSNFEIDAAEQRLKSANVDLPSQKESWRTYVTVEVYSHRMEQARDTLLDLHTCIPVARALFGQELEEALEELGKHFNSIRTYLDIKQGYNPNTDDLGFGLQMHAVLTTGHRIDGSNEMDDAITKQFAVVERICLPILRKASV
jgi:hypothetical protein